METRLSLSWSISFSIESILGCPAIYQYEYGDYYMVDFFLLENGSGNPTPLDCSSSAVLPFSLAVNASGYAHCTLDQPILPNDQHLIMIVATATMGGPFGGGNTATNYSSIIWPMCWTYPRTWVTNGYFQALFTDLRPDWTQIVEASPNLTNWTPIYTNPVPGTNLLFAEKLTSTNSYRFFRVRQTSP